MKYPSRHWLRAVTPAAFVLVALIPAISQAQQFVDDETLVIGQQRTLPTLYLQPFQGNLELSFTGSNSSQSSGGTTTNFKDMQFQENLTLSTSGYFVHPNLVDFSLSGTGGFLQQSFDNNGASQDNDSTLYDWNINATIFRNQMAPLSLFSQQSQTFLNQSFGPTIQTTSTTYGATWTINSKTIPTQFQYLHDESTQSGFGNLQDFTINRDVFSWHSEGRPASNQVLSWDYHYETFTQDTAGGLSESGESQAAALGHTLTFGNASQNTLNSSVFYTNTTGIFPVEILRWNENMQLRHTANFQTFYDYTLERNTYNTSEQDRQQASAGFRHKLYESLVTNGRLQWQQLDVSQGFSTTDYSAHLDFNYHKKVPFGMLLSNLDLGYNQIQYAGQAINLSTLNQPISFVGIQPILVSQQNIIPTTVIIRDALGRIYTPGLDYTLTTQPTGLEIDRVIGGALSPGQPLFLSYDWTPLNAQEITNETLGFGLRYDIREGWLRGFSPYFRFLTQSQEISGGTAIPNNVNDFVYGIDFRRGGLTLRAEEENYDSTLFPFEATRLEARYNQRLGMDTQMFLQTTYTITDYTQQNNQTNTFMASGSVSQQFTREISATASVSWVNVESSLSGQTQGLEEALEVHWRHRQTEIYARVRNSNLETENTGQDFQFIQIGLRRYF